MATAFSPFSIRSTLPRLRRNSMVLPVLALASLLVLQFHLAITRSINWDEFYFLGQIAGFADGAATKPLQTLHVRLFSWLMGIPGMGVDKIIAGRLVMLGCEIGTAGAIAAIARKFVDRRSALLAASAYLCAGYVMQHGWSFRTDPLAAVLVTMSLAVLARARLHTGSILIFGILLGAAGMVTMKSILVAPAFFGLAWLRWSESGYARHYALRLVGMPVAAIVSFCLIYTLHEHFMPATLGTGAAYAASAGRSMIFLGLPEYGNYARAAVLTSLPLAVMVLLTARASKPLGRNNIIAIFGLLAPLLTVFFYHNTLPYFYAFILPPVAAGSAVALPVLIDRLGIGLIAAVIIFNGGIIWTSDGQSRLAQQRAIQMAAHEMFPEPVAYFDFPNFLPEFRKANTFLTHWGFESYRTGSGPSYAEIMQKTTVPFVLTVDPTYDPTLLAAMERSERSRLFRDEDREILANTYRQFWGPFWLAGINLSAGQTSPYSVQVPGPYTVSGSDIVIDGELVRDKQILELDRQTIVLENRSEFPASLTWGKNIVAPVSAPPSRPYWTDF